jgi:hypothetical protein
MNSIGDKVYESLKLLLTKQSETAHKARRSILLRDYSL